LGEYLALAVSLEHLGETQKNQRALTLGSTLNKAIERLLENRKSPGRKVGRLCVQLRCAVCCVLCDVLYMRTKVVSKANLVHTFTLLSLLCACTVCFDGQ
jgi:hypothetical protein